MKKSKFIKSTIILLIGGFITKILGMIIKIVTTRYLGTEGIGIYSLIMPTFMILITLSQFGFPIAISKLVSEDKSNNKNLVFGIIPVSMLMNVIIIIFLILSSNFISTNLLNEKRTYYALLSMGFVLPFISISSIIRGYFFGKEKMIPHVLSNTIEDITRLILIILFLPLFLKNGIEFGVAFLILINIISELISILIFFFFIPKNFKFKKSYFKLKGNKVKEVMNVSLPITSSRIIGNIGYFFEPIIMTFCLLNIGYSNEFIITEYGILNGYIMPLLLLPSFFTMAISQALIPTVSNNYSRGNFNYTKNKIKQAVIISLCIGIPITLFIEFFPSVLLKLLYNTTEGICYLKFLAPICLLLYIQSPLSSSLQAMGKGKESMLGTLYGTIIRTVFLFVLSMFKIGLWGLVIATSINVIFVTMYQLKHIIKLFKKCS
ncbi:MAG: oligosaccharide flippase family protein [Bacilli bacterium]